MNIDDIADNKTDQACPGERFRNNWLEDLPLTQWPSYIEETAELVIEGISIGETRLTGGDFHYEVGEYYKKGLGATADIQKDGNLPIATVTAKQLGTAAWVFKKLSTEIRDSERTGVENPNRAIEAAVNKRLLASIGEEGVDAGGVETLRLPQEATVSDLMIELFCRPRGEAYVEAVVNIAEEAQHSDSDLLELIEQPRMTTPLWEHQQEALQEWLEADCRGYVDMATATGKTVLGLAAIAHQYGRLHPRDQSVVDANVHSSQSDTQRATVVVIAHRDIILNQWKQEFSKHLDIPTAGTPEKGEHTATFSWGTIHFWSARRLMEQGVPDADLVVLDESHHYVGSSGFGSVLDTIDCDVLALSGSLDETDMRSFERREMPFLYEFSLSDGRAAGIIPDCDIDVELVPYESQTKLETVTQRFCAGRKQYGDGPPEEFLERQGLDRDEFTFEHIREARSVIRTTAARTLKENDDTFREFTSAVKSRRLTKANLSPTLLRITKLTAEYLDNRKCIVLLESRDEIQTVVDGLERADGVSVDEQVTVVTGEHEDALEAVEQFDESADSGALIGTSQTLGEGVDIETVEVGINRGRGRLTHSLVQRMGRILRNPEGDKEARFHHVHGIPTTDDATLPEEDGLTLLETVSQLLVWGERFGARPVFNAEDSVRERITTLERQGLETVREFVPEQISWPDDDDVADQLQGLCADIEHAEEESVLLGLDRQSDGGGPEKVVPTLVSGNRHREVSVPEVFAEAVSEFDTSGGVAPINAAIRQMLVDRSGTADSNLQVDPGLLEDCDTVRLNPALAAVLSDCVGTERRARAAFVTESIARYLLRRLSEHDIDLGPDADPSAPLDVPACKELLRRYENLVDAEPTGLTSTIEASTGGPVQ